MRTLAVLVLAGIAAAGLAMLTAPKQRTYYVAPDMCYGGWRGHNVYNMPCTDMPTDRDV